jgi:hypothetical protein
MLELLHVLLCLKKTKKPSQYLHVNYYPEYFVSTIYLAKNLMRSLPSLSSLHMWGNWGTVCLMSGSKLAWPVSGHHWIPISALLARGIPISSPCLPPTQVCRHISGRWLEMQSLRPAQDLLGGCAFTQDPRRLIHWRPCQLPLADEEEGWIDCWGHPGRNAEVKKYNGSVGGAKLGEPSLALTAPPGNQVL